MATNPDNLQSNVFPTPDPAKQIGARLTDWARSNETTEQRQFREYVLYQMVVQNGEG